MTHLICYRDESKRIRYYHGVNCGAGRAVCGPKKTAPRFDEDWGGVILRQLPAVDNRDWQLVKDELRCKVA